MGEIRTIEQMLEFHYDPAAQRSPEWLARKRGKIGASRLEDWLAVSKAKATMGKPLKARLDYEKELMFERQFNTSFEVWVNDAMQEGIDYEDFACRQFAEEFGFDLAEVGCWYNEFMVVSPDRLVFPKGSNVTDFDNAVGGLEVKIVKDNTFTEILMSGVPPKHMKQVQAGLKATGLKKWWYVALNFNTKRYVAIPVEPDTEFHDYLMEAIQEELVTEPFTLEQVYAIKGELPMGSDGLGGANIDRSDNVKPAEAKSEW
jgi:hypothetical protein